MDIECRSTEGEIAKSKTKSVDQKGETHRASKDQKGDLFYERTIVFPATVFSLFASFTNAPRLCLWLFLFSCGQSNEQYGKVIGANSRCAIVEHQSASLSTRWLVEPDNGSLTTAHIYCKFSACSLQEFLVAVEAPSPDERSITSSCGAKFHDKTRGKKIERERERNRD